MSDRDEFLEWVRTRMYEAELALHNSDAAPRLAIWSNQEPVTVLGAWKSATNHAEANELFNALEKTLSDCTSYSFELIAADLLGDMAYTVGYEHTQASVNGEPRAYTLRATQIYRREGGSGRWRTATAIRSLASRPKNTWAETTLRWGADLPPAGLPAPGCDAEEQENDPATPQTPPARGFPQGRLP